MQISSMLLYPEKRMLIDDIMSGNPNKKLRLSFPKDENVANEDLWGQDEITAEEFDFLEVQATQTQNQNNNLNNVTHALDDFGEAENLKQVQYQLEGRIKILTHSLERSLKDLNEERLNRQKIINDKVKELSSKENNLKKEVEKLQTVIDFKEQEIKSIHSKYHLLKSQVERNSIICDATDSNNSNNKQFEDFLKGSSSKSESSRKTFNKFHRRNKLLINTSRGKAEPMDILSSVLCMKFAVPLLNCDKLTNSQEEEYLNSTFSPISVVHLQKGQKCDELFQYYIHILQNSVSNLKILSSKDIPSCSKTSPLSRRKEINCNRTLLSSLKEITCLLSHLKSSDFINENCNNDSYKNSEEVRKKTDILSSIFINKKTENCAVDFSVVLKLLLELANPNIYPVNYPKFETIELSLSALLTMSEIYPKKFIDNIQEYSICFFICPNQSLSSLCSALKILTNLSIHKEFAPYFVHKSGQCLLCSVAVLCNTILNNLEEYSFCMTLVGDFLSTVFTLHISEVLCQSSQCVSEVIQSLVRCMLKCLQIIKENNKLNVLMKKGFMLLHFLSNSVSNFKEKRRPVEDEYILLISGLITLSKDDLEFREFYDLLHNMWDFQTDISEFDLDEPCEETQTSNSDTD